MICVYSLFPFDDQQKLVCVELNYLSAMLSPNIAWLLLLCQALCLLFSERWRDDRSLHNVWYYRHE